MPHVLSREEAQALVQDHDAVERDDFLERHKTMKGCLLVLDPEFYRGDAYERLFVALDGFGCTAVTRGTAVHGFFVCDGEKCRVERYEVLAVVEGVTPPPEPIPLCDGCRKPLSELGPNEEAAEDGSRTYLHSVLGHKYHNGCGTRQRRQAAEEADHGRA